MTDAERELAATPGEPPQGEDITTLRAQALELITEGERVAQKLNDHVDLMRAYLVQLHETEEIPDASA